MVKTAGSRAVWGRLAGDTVSMPNSVAIEVNELVHRYGDRVALDQVTFQLEAGGLLGLLGPNGGGKSTLFKILATALPPTGGVARILGADVSRDRTTVRRYLGVVFQHPAVDGKLTVKENLRHQGHLHGLSGRTLRERIHVVTESLSVGDRLGDSVDILSGGLRRRVEIAKALLHKPRVLILDEPSTGLDPGARADLINHLVQLRHSDGVTVLLTTHFLDEADRCDRIGLLDAGRLVALDTPAALKATIGGDILTLTTTNPAGLADKVSERFRVQATVVGGGVRIERDRGHEFVTELIESYPGEIDSVTVGRPTLGDVFVHRTGHRLWDASIGAGDGT